MPREHTPGEAGERAARNRVLDVDADGEAVAFKLVKDGVWEDGPNRFVLASRQALSWRGDGPEARPGQLASIHETVHFTDGRLLYSTEELGQPVT